MAVGGRVAAWWRTGRAAAGRAGAWWLVVLVPALFTLGMARARPTRLYDTVDGNLVAGIVRNLRCCASLTSPVDQYWLRLDAATTYQRLPRLPVADQGPLYPVLVALVPASVDRAMWVVNALSGAAVLVLLAMVVHRATGSWAAGVAAQVMLVIGPTQHTVFGTVTWSNLVGTTVYDVTAVALLMGAVVASLDRRSTRRWPTIVLLVASCLVKPSFVIVLVALTGWRVVEALLRRRPARDAAPASVATALVVVWQFVLSPIVFGSAPKSLAWHPIRDMGFFEALLGWVRLDGLVRVSHVLGLVVGAAVLAGAAVLVVRRASDDTVPLLALVALAASLSLVVGRFVFDADVVLRDERQLLVVRVAAIALVVIALHRLLSATGRPGVLSLGVVVVVSLLVGTRPWFVPIPDRSTPPVVADMLAAHRNAVVMSNAPTTVYRQTGVSALTMLQPREPTTYRAVDVAAELSALARAMRDDGRSIVVDVRYDDYYLATVDPVWFECASLVDRAGGTGVEVTVIDIGGCADPAAVVPVAGSPVDVP